MLDALKIISQDLGGLENQCPHMSGACPALARKYWFLVKRIYEEWIIFPHSLLSALAQIKCLVAHNVRCPCAHHAHDDLCHGIDIS